MQGWVRRNGFSCALRQIQRTCGNEVNEMFGWIKRLFDSRCEFYDKCRYAKSDSYSCINGCAYFDGVCNKAHCGEFRRLAGWD